MESSGADWRAVPVPHRLNRRPRDTRGYPVTYVTMVKDGVPDFTTLDGDRIADCARLGLCGLCGEPLGAFKAFLGGPKSCSAGQFTDPPSHRDCAEYALAVCPFLATPTARYRKMTDDEREEVLAHLMDPDRPEQFGLYVTKKYQVANVSGTIVFVAAAPVQPVTWNREVVPS